MYFSTKITFSGARQLHTHKIPPHFPPGRKTSAWLLLDAEDELDDLPAWGMRTVQPGSWWNHWREVWDIELIDQVCDFEIKWKKAALCRPSSPNQNQISISTNAIILLFACVSSYISWSCSMALTPTHFEVLPHHKLRSLGQNSLPQPATKWHSPQLHQVSHRCQNLSNL